MAAGDREGGSDLIESREEAMEAIATALEFLRRETAALGLHEVSDMIGSVRVRIRSHGVPARGPDN